MALTDRGEIRAILEENGFHFSKAMGQNFLVNPAVCPKMAEASGANADTGVIEIGPGFGVLTEQLSKRANKVVCIELDKRLPPILAKTLAGCNNVTVIEGDAMQVDFHQMIKEQFGDMPVVLCANLPYYITTPILMRLLEEKLPIEAITVMVQKEAAERLCAPPGSRACGAISAAISYYCVAEPLFTVSPGSFMPPPKVSSQVIRLTVRKSPPVNPADERFLFKVVKAAFSQRRKRAVNSLSSQLSIEKQRVEEAFAACSIDPNARAEQLTLQQFSDLSDKLLKY